MSYNPFDRPLGETLQADDLQTLLTQQVAEGYYVEYKREMPSTIKIGRSLASFANTYGGWYIVGIKTNTHNVAVDVPGFDPLSCPDPISVVRELVKHHINPTPIFFPQIITLGTSNLVLVVYIPEDQAMPFITKDGRIYRRISDSSDPVPETNRYALDQIVERGKAASNRFERFSQDDRVLSQAEHEGWLKIYISPYPLSTIPRFNYTSTQVLTELLTLSKESMRFSSTSPANPVFGNIPFNAVYPTSDSVILRQTDMHREAFHSLTLELDIYGRAKLFIPLQRVQIEEQYISGLRSSIARESLLERLLADRISISHLRFFNIGQLWLVIACLVNFYLKWLGQPTTWTDFEVALELDQVWRFVPFNDSDSWGHHVSQFGMPILMRKENKPYRYIVDLATDLWMFLCSEVALACGLPTEICAAVLTQALIDEVERSAAP